ncbi:MAG: beta-lactamase family protein, partial [Caulobacterales bacterium]|nr:beta-lactamase family protein [Caulobacterales bacterium]
MSAQGSIGGVCPPAFEGVREVFQRSFDNDEETGARFTFLVEGQVFVDLWGGFADKSHTRDFDELTLTPVFSSSKAVAAFLIARLIDAGKLSYDQTVASVWPEFAQAGKAEITVAQALSHQAGLPGLTEPMDAAEWFDWDAICARVAAMAPMWPPGTASGYAPGLFGFVAGEIFRRVDGRTMGTALREDIAEPFGLDLSMGLPDSELARLAEVERPRSLPNFGKMNEARKAAFMTRWAAPGGARSPDAWRKAEFPSANIHATSEALARLAGALANDGMLDGVRLLTPETIGEASRERIAGPDQVLPYDVSWAAGFLRNPPNMFYGPSQTAFGHSGWGGSCIFADPENRVSAAYVMNRQSPELIGDRRAVAL